MTTREPTHALPTHTLRVDHTIQKPFLDGDTLVVPPELETVAKEALRAQAAGYDWLDVIAVLFGGSK